MQPGLELHLPVCAHVSPRASTDLKPTAELRLGLWTQPSAHPSCPNFSNTEAYSRHPDGSEPCPGQLWPCGVLTGERERDSWMSWSVLVIVEESCATVPALHGHGALAFTALSYDMQPVLQARGCVLQSWWRCCVWAPQVTAAFPTRVPWSSVEMWLLDAAALWAGAVSTPTQKKCIQECVALIRSLSTGASNCVILQSMNKIVLFSTHSCWEKNLML